FSQGYDSSGAKVSGATTNVLPCPDVSSTPTGAQPRTTPGDTSTPIDTSGCSSGITVGVLPWKDLGLSRSDVIDTYGNYYTYVVSGPAQKLCETITNKYSTSGTASEFTGKQLTPTLDARANGQSSGRAVAFAIIGHGRNGTGALASSGTTTD